MFLKNLSLVNFKSFDQADLEFSPKINCFVGKNGTGKTNLFDSIYYLSFCKSFCNPSDNQNIKHDNDFFVIQGEFSISGKCENIYCGQKHNQKKQFKRNKKEYKKLAEHIGLIPLVLISPADRNLIIGGSDERRKFIDGVISQYDRKYLDDLLNYNKALSQRNHLLKDFARFGNFSYESVEIWDDQLVNYGNRIFKKRNKFLEELLPIFSKYFEFISSKNEIVELEYQSHLHKNSLRELLTESIEKDRILQYTSKGIHKDELLLQLGNFPIKRIGSQGQQKTFLIALKLAQFDFIKNLNEITPILLFDDIFDKLDSDRVKQIVKLVADNHFKQIFFTDTSGERIERILKEVGGENKIFHIDKQGVRLG
ncbi:DNA replication/repair protein RecF [Bacteroidota bacterium]